MASIDELYSEAKCMSRGLRYYWPNKNDDEWKRMTPIQLLNRLRTMHGKEEEQRGFEDFR